MDEPIQVEIEPGAQPPRPAAFSWQGQRYPILQQGRSWQADDGHHYLVMVHGRRVYEIRHDPSIGGWRLCRTPQSFGSRGRHL